MSLENALDRLPARTDPKPKEKSQEKNKIKINTKKNKIVFSFFKEINMREVASNLFFLADKM
jgi:hypothetical protein